MYLRFLLVELEQKLSHGFHLRLIASDYRSLMDRLHSSPKRADRSSYVIFPCYYAADWNISSLWMYVNDAEFIQKVKREDICVDNVFLTMRNEYGPTICIYNTNGAGLSVSRSVVKAFRYVVSSVIVFAVAEALVLFRSTLKKKKQF